MEMSWIIACFWEKSSVELIFKKGIVFIILQKNVWK